MRCATVVDLTAYRDTGTRPPDYAQLACGKVAAARRALGLDHAAFARLIRDLTGWDPMPETVMAWEDDIAPPGDVLMVCLARLGKRGRS